MASNGWENYKKRKGLSVERAAAENTESVSGWEQYKRNKARESQARNGALAVNPIKRGTYYSEVTAQYDPDDYKNERLAEEAYRIFAGEEEKVSSPSTLRVGAGSYAAERLPGSFVGPLTQDYIREETAEKTAGKLRDLTNYAKEMRDRLEEPNTLRVGAGEKATVTEGPGWKLNDMELPEDMLLGKTVQQPRIYDEAFVGPIGQYDTRDDIYAPQPGKRVGAGEAIKLDPQMIGYENLKNEPDFKEVLAKPRNVAQAATVQGLLGQLITNPSGVREGIETARMTKDEQDIYYYLLGSEKYGPKEAEKYYRSIEDSLNQRKGIAMYDNTQSLPDWAKTAYEMSMPVVGGLDQTISGIGAIGDVLTGDTQGRAPSPIQYADMLLGAKLNEESGWTIPGTDVGWKKALHDAVQTTSAQIPQYTAAVLGAPGLGMGMLYASAFGNTYNQSRQDGYSVGESIAMGVASASIEGITEKIGGPLWGEQSVLFRKLLGPKIDNIAKPVLKALAETGLDAVGEGLEEVIAAVAEPVVEEYILSDEDERTFIDKLVDGFKNIDLQELLYSGVLGAASGTAIGAPINVINNRAQQAVKAAAEGVKNPKNTQEQKAGAAKAALEAAGVKSERMDDIAGAMAKIVNGEKATNEELELLASTPGALEVADQISNTKVETSEKTGSEEANADEQTEERPIAEESEAPDEPESEPLDVETNRETAIETAAKLGGERRIHEEIYDMGDGSQDSQAYANEFERAYNRGANNLKLTDEITASYTTLNPEQVQAAWNEGRKAYEATIAKKPVRSNVSMNGKVGLVDATALKGLKLNTNQRASIAASQTIAEALGIKVVWEASTPEQREKQMMANGWYLPKDQSIHLDVYAGSVSGSNEGAFQYATMRTFSHELTHYIQDQSPAQYAQLRDMVFGYLQEQGMDVEALIEEKAEAYSSMEGYTRFDVTQEVIADACEMMLRDSTAVEMAIKKDPSLWERIKEKFTQFVEDLRAAFGRVDKLHPEAKALMREAEGVLRYAEELQKKWDEALLSTRQETAEDTNTSDTEPEQTAPETEQNAPEAEQSAQEAEQKESEAEQTAPEEEQREQPQKREGVTPMEDRDWESIKDRSMPPFAIEVPEVREWFAMAAELLQEDLAASTPGQKFYIPVQGNEPGSVNVTGQKRNTVDEIAQLLDHGMSYRNISDVLDAYAQIDMDWIRKHPQTAKKAELMLDQMLTDGYTNIEGDKLQGVQDYKALMDELAGRETKEPAEYDLGEDVRFSRRDTSLDLSDMRKYSLREHRIIEGYMEAVDPEIERMVNDVKSDRAKYVRPYVFGTADERTVEVVGRETGIDIRGYRYALEKSNIEHILRRHGENGEHDRTMQNPKDIARMQFAIERANDFDVIRNRDGSVAKSRQYKNGDEHAPMFLYKTKIDGTYYVAIAALESKKKMLRVVSAYMQVNGSMVEGSLLSHAAEDRPSHTPETETDSASNTSISGVTAPVNEDIRYQPREEEYVSNRELLANALASAAQTVAEQNKIAEYKRRVRSLDIAQNRVANIREEMAEINKDLNDKTIRESEKAQLKERLENLKAQRDALEREINEADKVLLKLEATEPLQKVVKRERKAAMDRVRAKANERRDVDKYKQRIANKVASLSVLLTRPTTKKYVPDPIRGPVAEFLSSISFVSKRQLQGGKPTKKDMKFAESLAALQRVMSKVRDRYNDAETSQVVQEGFGGYLDLPEGFVNSLTDLSEKVELAAKHSEEGYNVNMMSVAQLESLDRIITTLKESIQNVNEFLGENLYKHIDQAARDTYIDLGDMRNRSHSTAVGEFFEWENAMPAHAFDRFGRGGKAIFYGLMRGQGKLGMNAKQVTDFANDTYTAEEARKWAEDIKSFKFGEDELKIPVTHIMSLYCLRKREQAQGHLHGEGIRVEDFEYKGRKYKDSGRTVDDRMLDEIVSVLTDRQKAVADKLQEYMVEVGSEWGNEVSMRRFGYRAFEEKNYFPINSDGNHLAAVSEEGGKGNAMYALLNISPTKELTPKANNRLMLYNIFDVFANHMSDMAQYNAMALPLLDAIKWINYKESTNLPGSDARHTLSMQDAITKAYGEPAKRYVIRMLEDVSGRKATVSEDKMTGKMLGRVNRAAVAANLRVAVLQPLSLIRAGMDMDALPIVMGLAKNPVHLRENVEKMQKYSGIAVWKDLGFRELNISRGLKKLIKHDETAMERVVDKSMALAEAADKFTWAAMWEAAEIQTAKKMSRSDERFYGAVRDLFEKTVYRTQMVDSVLTKSQYMRTPAGMNKWFSAFMSEPVMTYNMLASVVWKISDDARVLAAKDAALKGLPDTKRAAVRNAAKYMGNAVKKNMQLVGRTFAVYSASVVATTMLEALMTAWRDDDDYEKFVDKLKETTIWDWIDNANPLAMVPVGSQMWDLFKIALNKFGSDAYGFEMTLPMTDIVNTATDLIEMWNKWEQGKGNATGYGVAYKGMQLASDVAGLPFANVAREAITLWNNAVASWAPELRVTTYKTENVKGAESYIRAVRENNDRLAAEMMDELEANNVTGEALTDAMEDAIKAAYKKGDMDKDESARLLKKYAGYEEKRDDRYEAERLVREWEVKGESGANSQYAWVWNHIAQWDGKALKKEIQELKKLGVEDSQIRSSVLGHFKEIYLNAGRVEKTDLKAHLITALTYMGDTSTKAKERIKKWEEEE